jgi:hypothetical protein
MRQFATSDSIASDKNDDWLLASGLKSILRCDDAKVVQEIARYVISQHRALSFLSRLIERTRATPLPGVIALIGFLRAFLAVRPGTFGRGIAWIARLSNERKAIEILKRHSADLSWDELKFKSVPDSVARAALWRSLSPRRILRITRLLHRRYEFFKVLRVIELVAYYSRYLEIFRKGQFSLAVTSNHSNPHGIAFNLAARKCRVPVVLVSHGMPIRPVARLHYDLALVHCEAARQTYLQEGCRFDRVLVHGRRQNHLPMPPALPERVTMGIFLCKDVNEERLHTLIDHLLEHPVVSRILIRPHPKNLCVDLDKSIARRSDSRLLKMFAETVFSDIEKVNIVLGGNSSVLVDAVTSGRPAGYVPGLDSGSQDLHGFVASGLVCTVEVGPVPFNLDAMLRFYQRPGWSTVLRQFANVEEDDAAVADRAVEIMRALATSTRRVDRK